MLNLLKSNKIKLNYTEIAKEYIDENKTLNYLASKYNISVWTLLSNFKKIGIKKKINRYYKNKFNEFTPESCYWGGFLAADGWVSKYSLGVELKASDFEHLNKFIKFMESNIEISYRIRKGKKYCITYIYSKEIVDSLNNNFNIIKRKSLIYEPPNINDEELIRNFIRGYFDGDGSISWNKSNKQPRLTICSGSIKLIELVKNNIYKFTKTGRPSIRIKNKNTYEISYDGVQTYKIFDWIYNNLSIYLNRKYERYTEYVRIKEQKDKEKIEKENFIKKIIELRFKENLTIVAISKKLNISQGSVRYYIKKDCNVISN